MTAKVIEVGLVGAGYIATEVHLPLLTRFRNVQVAAICDSDNDRLAAAGNRFKIPRLYSNLDEMLDKEKLDLVDICTPPDTHARLAIQALEGGCNCLVEKPMALSTNDADRMIKTAQETGLSLNVIHNYSYLPGIRKAKSMVDAGDIGELVSIEAKYAVSIERERYFDASHWCHRLPGGIFSTEITPHLIMLLLDFLGDTNVKCVNVVTDKLSKYPHIPADELRVTVKGDSALGFLNLSYNSPLQRLTLNITGTKGCLYVNGDSQAVVKYKPTKHRLQSTLPRGLALLSEIYQLTAGLCTTTANVVLKRYTPLAEGHKYLMKECFRSLRGEGRYPVDIYKCREVVRLLGEIFQSTK